MPTRCTKQIAVLLGLAVLTACDNSATPPPDEAATTTDDANSQPVATMPRSPSPEGASVFFITPADGDTVSNPIRIEFGISGMTVARAGDAQPHSGHHHLIIDAGLPDLGAPIPANDNYVHFGDASTSTEITLDPGEHTLRLLLGDHLHMPHDPPVTSDPITVTVE